MVSGPVTWSSKRKQIVTLSTTEAEYVGASLASRKLMWLRKLVSDIECQGDIQITLYIDNQSTIRIAKNPEFHNRTKHIDTGYHYI